MVQVICCSSLLSTSGGAGAFRRDVTINLPPQCRAFSRALKNDKLKALLFPVPGLQMTGALYAALFIIANQEFAL